MLAISNKQELFSTTNCTAFIVGRSDGSTVNIDLINSNAVPAVEKGFFKSFQTKNMGLLFLIQRTLSSASSPNGCLFPSLRMYAKIQPSAQMSTLKSTE